METQYRITGRNIVKVTVDNENKLNVNTIDNSPSHIDWLWVIEEDGTIEYNNKTYKVKSGDVVIKFYNSASENLAIINSPEWFDIIIKEKKEYEERMKQRELCKPCNNCDGCCDVCEASC